jgi:hypothetical protein
MVDEKQPAKKVVKRVVKKTVVRPASPAPAARTVGRPSRPVATAPRAKAAAPPPKAETARPKVEVGAKVGSAGRALGARGAGVASGAASGLSRVAGSAWQGARTRGGSGLEAMRGWRVPQLHPVAAAALTGALAGLVTVVLGVGAKALFAQIRGVPTGGGAWGSLAVVVVTALTVVVGARLLAAFGAEHAGLTSFLGAIFTVILVLAFFLAPSDTAWALLLFPALGALSYAAAHLMLDQAEKMPRRVE